MFHKRGRTSFVTVLVKYCEGFNMFYFPLNVVSSSSLKRNDFEVSYGNYVLSPERILKCLQKIVGNVHQE